MKFKKLITVSLLSLVLTFMGCSTQNSNQAKKGIQSQTTQQATEIKSKPLTIEEGSKNMRNVITEMKTYLKNKEEDKVIKTSEGLEGNWKQFEDNAKAKSPDLYNKIEDPLHTITAATKVKPLDTKVLNNAMDNLDKQLEQLQNLK